jgi:ribonuclease HII
VGKTTDSSRVLTRCAADRRAGSGLLGFDRSYRRGGRVLAGVDEAGRGPLAGPVVGCAVVLDTDSRFPRLDDSKRLTSAQREELFDDIMRQALAVSWACVGEKLIDTVNILRASILAMTWSVESLQVKPDMLLVDGPYRLGASHDQLAVIGADGLSLSVAAASVVAKVVRDRIMVALSRVYPHYYFECNKGYPTRLHLEALSRHGPCPAHRFSFQPVKVSAQMSLMG